MTLYLRDIPLAEAQDKIKTALLAAGLWRVLEPEIIPLDENAVDRVVAEPIWAKTSSPNYHASAMDGFAVRAEDTNGAQPSAPIELGVVTQSLISAQAKKAQYLDTGDALPLWANAVIPIENVESLDEHGMLTALVRHPAAVRIRAAIVPWSHVRPLGEDIVETQLVLHAGHVLRPVDLGAIAAAGYEQIKVARKPRVAILPTGSELVPIGSNLRAGDILEYNSLVLAAQVKAMGGEPRRFPIAQDDIELICKQVNEAVQGSDLILLNAGSSAGSEDYSAKVVEKLGTLLVHGVAVRPGHPVIFGTINRYSTDRRSEKSSDTEGIIPSVVPIIGVPGYPVSAALTVEIFVEPLIAKWLGRDPAERPTLTARLSRKMTSPAGDEDYVRVTVGKVGEKYLAAPLPRGAGIITSLVQADGLVIVPAGIQGLEAGDQVAVHLYRSKAEIERTILCIGSHDLALDVLAQYLRRHDRRFISANVGSQGGLMALRREEAHLSGAHLLDPKTGEYNLSYIRQYMPGIPVKVVAFVGRQQGLVVKRGNPLHLNTLRDLSGSKVRFINRQRGAGTRVLLDYHLGLMDISRDSILGYDQEEYTHLGVASAVASGRADCGLAIAAAAQALDLDFIPQFKERYDLIFPLASAKSKLIAPLFDVLNERKFREAVSGLMGYDVSVMGNLIMEDK